MGNVDHIADIKEQAAQKIADQVAPPKKGATGFAASPLGATLAAGEAPAAFPKNPADTLQGTSQSGAQLAAPYQDKALNATQAGTMGLPGIANVNPTDAEIAAATTQVDPTVRGYVDTGLKNKDIQPPLVVPPESTPAPAAPPVTKSPPGIAKQTPTTKDMISNILSGGTGSTTESTGGGFNFADLLKGAGGKLGDFLQRWGMGLQGAPTGQTQGDIQRAQQFELQKQSAQAEIMVRQQALANTYEIQRMQLQNQLNVANLPIEAKYQLQNRLAELDANYQNEVRLLPKRIEAERASATYNNFLGGGVNPAMSTWSRK